MPNNLFVIAGRICYVLPKTSYNFTLAASSSFGKNLAPLSDGKFGLWSGGVNQDELVESFDYSEIENASQLLFTGYEPTDLTGDGLVESSDYSLGENNSQLFLFCLKP